MEVFAISRSSGVGSCTVAHYMTYWVNYLKEKESSLDRWMPGVSQVTAL